MSCSCTQFPHSLRLDHHSAVSHKSRWQWVQWPPLVLCFDARETWPHTVVEPPSATAIRDTTTIVLIVVAVDCWEFHSVMVVDAEITVTIPVTFVVEWVSRVSTVSRHFQSIFGVQFVADLKWPVLGRVPEFCGPFLYLHSQSVRLVAG